MRRIKFVRFLTLLIACSMMFSIAACKNSDTKETTLEATGNIEETEETKTSETDTKETTDGANPSVAESDVIEVLPTESEVKVEFVSCQSEYDLFMDYADKLYSELDEDTKALFSLQRDFDEESDSEFVLYVREFSSEDKEVDDDEELVDKSTCYGIKNGEVISLGDVNISTALLSYEDFKKLPVPAPLCTSVDNYESFVTESLEDGKYTGRLLGFTADGTKALVEVGDFITYTSEQYEALEDGQEITEIYDCPWISSEEDCTWSSEEIHFCNDCFFVETKDGDYVIKAGNEETIPCNIRYIVIDISPDIVVYDPNVWETGDFNEDDYFVTDFVYDDGENNFANTYLFRELMAGGKEDYYYDPLFMDEEWVSVCVPISELVVEDGSIIYAMFRG